MNDQTKKIVATRRIIYLLVLIFLATPILLQKSIKLEKMLPGFRTQPVVQLYNYIEGLPKGSQILFSFFYSPSSEPEVGPMATALLRHCFRKGIIPVTVSFTPESVGLMNDVISKVSKEMNKKERIDFVNLGFIPIAAFTPSIIVAGENFKRAFPKDHHGVSTFDIKPLKNVNKLSDFELIVDLTPSGTIDLWVMYGVEKYNIKLAGGVTGVMAADYYPFLDSGQLIGILPGLSGAYQYERIMNKIDRANVRMVPMVSITALIIFLIILGNVTYWLSRRKDGIRKRI